MTRYILLLLLGIPALCFARAPAGLPCANWPVNVTEVKLQNAGILKIPQLDESRTKATPVSIEKIGKDLYRQVFDITLYSRAGHDIHVVTVNDASSSECSMSDVTVYVISRKFDAQKP